MKNILKFKRSRTLSEPRSGVVLTGNINLPIYGFNRSCKLVNGSELKVEPQKIVIGYWPHIEVF